MPEVKPRTLSPAELKYGTNRNIPQTFPKKPQKVILLKPLPPEHLE